MPRKPTVERAILMEHWRAGLSQAQIGAKYGITPAGVSRLLRTTPGWKNNNRRAWTDDRKRWAVQLYATGMTVVEVAAAIGSNDRHVSRALQEAGVPRRLSYAFPRGSVNPSWSGGRTVQKGYVYVRLPGHPNALKSGYVAEHRLVMEAVLGRFLSRREVVHHRNGDRRDNRPENLELFASNAAHLAATLKGKCPNWTEDGKRRIRDRYERHRRKAS